MAAILLAFVVVGFFPSLYLQTLFDFPPLPVHLHIHGAVLTTWFLLLLVQPYLVRTNRVALHRRIGAYGGALAVAVVAVSVWTLVHRDAPTIDEFPNRSAGNIASLFMFMTCAVIGLLLRKQPNAHKRLMLLASIPIAAPALDRVARIPYVQASLDPFLGGFPPPVEVVFATLSFLVLILTVVVFDFLSTRRVQAGTCFGLLGIFVVAPGLTAAVMVTGAWETLVRLFIHQ